MELQLKPLLEKLTGQKIPLEENLHIVDHFKDGRLDLGYSQFNELLLFLGYDRVSYSFFQFLVDGTVEFNSASSLHSLDQFARQVDKVVEYSLRLFGNIKFGYKRLSSDLEEEDFVEWYEKFQPRRAEEFTSRHLPLIAIDKINDADTYLLGYIIQDEIKRKLSLNPNDEGTKAQKELMITAIEKGRKNHQAYLASDHMDVYVATSMRLKHEYLFISRITDAIFNQEDLRELNVRYFDPTQAYCSDRVDKGIAEALMLKRAACTIYLAQETDTLGKDSELASTLAQGKTVIAYIPRGDKAFVDQLLTDLKALEPSRPEKEIVLEQLQIFNPSLCWTDAAFRDWMVDADASLDYGMQKLYEVVQSKYESRARTLKDTHPLGIQVNLETGVANGVIVTRDIGECAKLVRNVLLGQLEFKVVEETRADIPYVFLREALTDSVYRVSSGEKLLANTFWNYYLSKY
ncbi:MAG TPA: hypothetical protein VGN63_15185 [Flavisolibacter sp.]|jgi:hypothetical protein|nr:hypothetical protein [Flavisolibacter sp.]